MPNIAMCQQEQCCKHSKCYRFIATPSEYRQTYFVPIVIGENCTDFWAIDKVDEPKEQRDV